MTWVIAGSAAFGVGGVFMKSADGFTRLWPSVAIVVMFLIGAVMLTLAVRSQGLSVAYTLGLGIEAVFAVLLGRFLFDEPVRAVQMLGIGLILAGVATVRAG